MRHHLPSLLTALALAAVASACGDARPVGHSAGLLECQSCHGTPPPPPHPEAGDCVDCHSATVDEETNIKPGGGHLNGRVDFAGEGATCSSCHGYPPPEPHPQLTDCSQCHAGTVRDDDQTIIPPEEGGGHMNGHVDATGGHEVGFANPAVHGLAANASLASCRSCHGADFGGGTVGRSCNACHGGEGYATWQANCTFCHGAKTQSYGGDVVTAAPPQGVNGETATTDPEVGAHQKHLGNGSVVSNGFTCEACHTVPTDLSHVDGGDAELTFGSLATTGGLSPSYNGAQCSNVYCHGASLTGGLVAQPTWTAPPSVLCGSCHGLPPNTGRHSLHVTSLGAACADCHAGGAATVPNKATHVNGTRNVVFAGQTIDGWDCDTCHDLR